MFQQFLILLVAVILFVGLLKYKPKYGLLLLIFLIAGILLILRIRANNFSLFPGGLWE